MTPILTFGPFQLTAYGLCILAGTLAGMLLCLRNRKILPVLGPVLFGALVLGHLCWVIFCPRIYSDEKLSMFFRFWEGGYTMYGALAGGTLGALAAVRLMWLRQLLVGPRLFFPISFCTYSYGDYQEWSYAVWAWEALAALILLAVLLIRFRAAPEGRAFAVFITGLGASQIVLEQARKDSFVSLNPFVRFTQIAAALALLALLVYLTVRYRPSPLKAVLVFASFAAAVFALVMAEYVFDKYNMAWILYLAQSAAGILAFAAAWAGGRRGGRIAGGFCALLSLLLVLLHALNGRQNSPLVLYGMMTASACAMALAAAVSLPGKKGETA